jgi:hypothetical protein
MARYAGGCAHWPVGTLIIFQPGGRGRSGADTLGLSGVRGTLAGLVGSVAID